MRRSSIAKGVIHGLLLVYALILVYILSGLIFKFYIQADIFFDLSFALLFFTLVQCFYELGTKKGYTLLNHNFDYWIPSGIARHEYRLSVRKILLHGFPWSQSVWRSGSRAVHLVCNSVSDIQHSSQRFQNKTIAGK